MNFKSVKPSVAGLFIGTIPLFAGVPWWMVGTIIATAVAVRSYAPYAHPLLERALSHRVHRHGDFLDKQLAEALSRVHDGEKRAHLLIEYRRIRYPARPESAAMDRPAADRPPTENVPTVDPPKPPDDS